MTTMQFEGKVALVTGAGQGIGAVTARLAGAAVVLASRNEREASTQHRSDQGPPG